MLIKNLNISSEGSSKGPKEEKVSAKNLQHQYKTKDITTQETENKPDERSSVNINADVKNNLTNNLSDEKLMLETKEKQNAKEQVSENNVSTQSKE